MSHWADNSTLGRSQAELEASLRSYVDAAVAAGGGGGGAIFASSDDVLFVSGTGSDAASGLGPGQAMRTLAAAYAALPSAGGRIYALPGRYDVGAGFGISRGKPLELIGVVKPEKTIGSAVTAPLSLNAAILYTSAGAVSLVTTTSGTAGQSLSGCKFRNLVFEFSHANTLYGIHATQVNLGEIRDCMAFADKTSGSPGPANVAAALAWIHDAQGTSYGGSVDASWWIIEDNSVTNLALCVMGNPTGSTSSNRNWISRNYGNGLQRTNTSCLPFITLWSNHGSVVRDNNFEAYNVGLKMDSCWMCREDGDAGEAMNVFIDMYNTKGCFVSPMGASWAPLGSSTPYIAGTLLVRADQFTKANVFVLSSVWKDANLNRVYPPIDNATNPAISFDPAALADNIIISPRYSLDAMDQGGTLTSTPGAVTTLNIPHLLGTTPDVYSAQAANANARGAPAFYVTADATNVILTFASALTAATSYAWAWRAKAR
jgi:hypothetical protein